MGSFIPTVHFLLCVLLVYVYVFCVVWKNTIKLKTTTEKLPVTLTDSPFMCFICFCVRVLKLALLFLIVHYLGEPKFGRKLHKNILNK